jgi:serine phosphatase RsbU (regulator of sigma subunit)
VKRKALEKLIQQKKELEEKQLELDDKMDELTVTAEIVEAMNIDLQQQHQEIENKNEELIKQHKLVEAHNKSIQNSIEYAKRIQDAALKSTLELPFKENFIIFKPKDIVSGDFYLTRKFFNYTVIAAVDCTGHGVPGAFMSLLGLSMLNEITYKHYRKISRTGFEPAKILDELRENIIRTLNQTRDLDAPKDGMDIALCIYDEETNEMQFAGAYNPLILIRNDEFKVIKGDNMPIGIHLFKDTESKPFTNHKIKMAKDDRMYIFSDGYQDQFGEEEDRKFLRRHFYELLHEIHQNPMPKQKEMLETALAKFQGNTRQTDDILVIGIRV